MKHQNCYKLGIWFLLTVFCGLSTTFAQTQDTTTFVAAVVYPNPFTNKLYIKHNKLVENLEEISIYDAIGNLIYSYDVKQISDATVVWNGNNFTGGSVNSGTYIIYIRTRKRAESYLIQKI